MMNTSQFFKFFNKKDASTLLKLQTDLTIATETFLTSADYNADIKAFNKIYHDTFAQFPAGCTSCGGKKKIEAYIVQLNNALTALNEYIIINNIQPVVETVSEESNIENIVNQSLETTTVKKSRKKKTE